MDISEIRKEKAKLEAEILEFLQGKVTEFRHDTGETIESIDVGFWSVRPIGHTRPEISVLSVKVRVSF